MGTPSNLPGIDVDRIEYMVYNPQHWLRRERAFSHVFEEIDDLVHQAWLVHKRSKTYTYF